MSDAAITRPAPDVAVVGSLHMDVVAEVRAFPRPGETVLASRHFRNPGGKGANQAVAAARLGSRVAMIGQVGDDGDGRALRKALVREGVDCGSVSTAEGTPSGTALITVDQAGENVIVVSPGASGGLAPAHVDAAAATVRGAATVLLQLEVPIETVVAAAEAARGTVILNPAPAAAIPEELIGHAGLLVPNRGELARLCDAEPAEDLDRVAAQARRFSSRCVVVVTLGAEGLVLCRGDDVLHVPAPSVEVRDTTAAGDALCGALADGLARGLDVEAASRRAVVAGALAVTRAGAQQSLPTRAEVDQAMGRPR